MYGYNWLGLAASKHYDGTLMSSAFPLRLNPANVFPVDGAIERWNSLPLRGLGSGGETEPTVAWATRRINASCIEGEIVCT